MPIETVNTADSSKSVVKSDRVVAMSTENGKLTASLYKCINAIILSLQNHVSERYDNFSDFEEASGNSVLDVTLPFSRFVEYMGWRSGNRKKAGEVVAILEDLKIKWDILGNDLNDIDIGFQHFVTAARIEGGQITFRLDPDIRRELLNIEQNPQIQVNLMIANAAWSDKYTPVLYEHCNTFIRDGRYEFQLHVEKLREMFNVAYTIEDGVKKWRYPAYKEFNRNVISKAVDNINNTDIVDFTIESQTSGRPVEYVLFTLTKKSVDLNTRDKSAQKLLHTVNGQLLERGLIEITLKYYELDFLEEASLYQLHYIKDCIARMDQQIEKGNVRSVNTYFQTMLEKNTDAFRPEWVAIEKKLKKDLEHQRIMKQRKIDEIQTEITRNYKQNVVFDYLANLSESESQKLRDECMQFVKSNNPSILKRYSWDSPIMKSQLSIYILDNKHPELMDQKKINKLVKTRIAQLGL